MDRRALLAGLSAGAAAVAFAESSRARSSGAPVFVLVHGAWHGAWCWGRVVWRLARHGRVLTPTLTGVGERAAELSPEVSLETHVRDVAGLIEREDLTDVVLCGHSYGGMVVTAVCDRLKARIRHVVYLDAAVPDDGESMITQQPGITPAEAAATEAALRALAPDGVAMGVFEDVTLFGVARGSPEEALLKRRLTPHPLRTWTDPIRLTAGGSEGLARTYVHCVNPPLVPSSFPLHAARVRRDPTWRYVELATGHDAMLTDPDGVAGVLVRAAAQPYSAKS